MNKKIILLVCVCALCLVFAACNRCGVRSKNVTIDKENYNSVATVTKYFTIAWEDRESINYEGTVKVYGWSTAWRGEKEVLLHHEAGGTPVIYLQLELSNEEMHSLIDLVDTTYTTTFNRRWKVEGEVSFRMFSRNGNCIVAVPVIIVNDLNNIYVE